MEVGRLADHPASNEPLLGAFDPDAVCFYHFYQFWNGHVYKGVDSF